MVHLRESERVERVASVMEQLTTPNQLRDLIHPTWLTRPIQESTAIVMVLATLDLVQVHQALDTVHPTHTEPQELQAPDTAHPTHTEALVLQAVHPTHTEAPALQAARPTHTEVLVLQALATALPTHMDPAASQAAEIQELMEVSHPPPMLVLTIPTLQIRPILEWTAIWTERETVMALRPEALSVLQAVTQPQDLAPHRTLQAHTTAI
jgi:hypothetical protein